MPISEWILLAVLMSPGLWMIYAMLTEDYKYDPNNWAD